MRIALVVPGGVSRDGEYKVIPAILWLIERLARRHDVQVIVPLQEPRPGKWRLLGATIHNIGSMPGRFGAVRTLLHLHRQKPFDLFHAMWARGPGEVALLAARLCRRPLIVHVAGGEFVWLPEVPFGARRSWVRAAARFVIRHANRVSAASGPMLDLIESFGVRPVRVPLGVDTTKWIPEPSRPRPDDRPGRLVQVGSLTPVKDHRMLLQAISLLKQAGYSVRADLVGEDTSGGTVQRLAHELNIHDRVRFHGFLPQHKVIPVVRKADLMTVTSRHEAGPVAMLEAAAVGVPTIGTPVGHIADWAPEAALTTPTSDADALARSIANLLRDDSRRLTIAGRAQRKAVEENADWTCARFEQLYAEVASDAKGATRRT